jgi:hypothetical protein
MDRWHFKQEYSFRDFLTLPTSSFNYLVHFRQSVVLGIFERATDRYYLERLR